VREGLTEEGVAVGELMSKLHQ